MRPTLITGCLRMLPAVIEQSENLHGWIGKDRLSFWRHLQGSMASSIWRQTGSGLQYTWPTSPTIYGFMTSTGMKDVGWRPLKITDGRDGVPTAARLHSLRSLEISGVFLCAV